MQIIDSKTQDLKLPQGQVVTIGNFDGVHLGHQKLIRQARTRAQALGVGVLAMTFDPHPVAILQPHKKPGMLTPLGLKQILLERSGVDYLLIIRDNYNLLSMSPQQFVDDFLVHLLHPRHVFEGTNFNFGYGRSGNVQLLAEFGAARGFEVHVVESERLTFADGASQIVSSTLIRHFLENGNVEDSASALGRPYRLIGNIIRGRGKGRELGFPTANLDCPQQVIPAEGVYAGFVVIGDNQDTACKDAARIPAAISIGRAKTFVGENPLLLEAHILETPVSDLYDKWMGIDFVAHIRSQQRFESIEKLKSQIAIDCGKIKSVLTNSRGHK